MHPKIDFHCLFSPINFNSTALFKNALLGLDLAGRPFGCDFEQLGPWKMKKQMFPIASLASGVSPGTTVEHLTQEPNLAIFGCLVAAGRNPFP